MMKSPNIFEAPSQKSKNDEISLSTDPPYPGKEERRGLLWLDNHLLKLVTLEHIDLAILPAHDPDATNPPLRFSQYDRRANPNKSRSRVPCEWWDQDNCSKDDVLWADDEELGYFGTNHFFPPEQNGYEFVEIK